MKTLFRPSNHSNDNIALLEAGFNKEIGKNTTLLLKQEKEMEAFQTIRDYLDQEAANTLHPEAEATNPAFKLYLKFKSDNVSYEADSEFAQVTCFRSNSMLIFRVLMPTKIATIS